jgi:prophage regulatory protein
MTAKPTRTTTACPLQTSERSGVSLAADPILRWPDVARLVPISRSHAHHLAARGEFPKPIKLGSRASGWLLSEINQWLEVRVAKSRPDSPDAA